MGVLIGSTFSRAEQIYVKPGNFSYFDAYIPTSITAGQSYFHRKTYGRLWKLHK
jgi:hypothetical protein